MSDNEYQKKQIRILSFIEDCKLIIESIQKAHVSERFLLMYPRSKTSTESRKSQSLSGPRNARSMDFKLLAMPNELVSFEGDMEEGSLGRMLGSKMADCISYLNRLSARVGDKTSKIMITGDVNSGKSTFINALLRKDILPTDQQPCTQCFCEILTTTDDESHSVVHATTDYTLYNPKNPGSFDLMTIREMQEKVQDEETLYQLFKVYLGSSELGFVHSQSMDFSLIDSPGLNSDLFKTMSLFSKQEDIDVIVFLVNAANHLTLSARQFLETASSEKAYIFIVVNKFDDIKNRGKCRRMVLTQIQEVLPMTFEDRDELIHFVSANCFNQFINNRVESPYSIEIKDIGVNDPTFDYVKDFYKLEQDLRKFILDKRTKSKLLPAKTYLIRVLSEVCHLLDYNNSRRQEELSKIEHELAVISPSFDSLMAHNGIVHADLRRTSEESCQQIYEEARLLSTQFRVSNIIRSTPWCGTLNLYKFNRIIHEQIIIEGMKWFDTIKSKAVCMTIHGLENLHFVAVTHAKSVFKNPTTDGDRINIPSVFDKMDGYCPIPKPITIWQSFEVSAIMRSSTWVSAATLAGAIFGYQPLFSLALRFFDLSRHTGRLFTIAIMTGVGALAFTTLIGDVEVLVRDRLERFYDGFYSSTLWTHESARKIESLSRGVLIDRQNNLILQFDNALHQQRQLQATKNLQRTQALTAVKYLGDRLRQSKSLMSMIEEFQI